jgi:hypothetical protein
MLETEQTTISTAVPPNNARLALSENATLYRQAYDFYFAQLPPEVQTEVIAAKVGDTGLSPGVRAFIKRVIGMAEQGS